jgi:hypothetical protein
MRRHGNGFIMVGEPVNIAAAPQSRRRERPRNGGFDTRIRWFDGLREYLGDIAVAPTRYLWKFQRGTSFGRASAAHL